MSQFLGYLEVTEGLTRIGIVKTAWVGHSLGRAMVNQVVELSKDVVGVQIPSGEQVSLPAGTRVYITQNLGNSYTVATDFGLVRLSGEATEALGVTDTQEEAASEEEQTPKGIEDQVWETLKNIYDPEIPVDIVNLGLIYDIVFTQLENDLYHVAIKMTLTAPGCGMGPHLMEEARARVEALPEVETAEVEMIWDPPWNQDMVSEEGKMKLGLV
jgi:probable FeS assembly SUF system protein SufT